MSITPRQLEIQASHIQDAYMALEDELTRMLIKVLNQPTRTSLNQNNSLFWKIEKMSQLNMLNTRTLQNIANQTRNYSYEQLQKIIIDSGHQIVGELDQQIYQQTGQVLPNTIDNLLESLFNQQWLELDNHVNQTLINTNYPNNSLSQAYQQVLNDTVAKVTTGLMTPEQALRSAIYEWSERGIMSSFVDKSGRRWSLERYVRTVLRTTTHRTYQDARLKRGLEHGIVTALMSEHHAARPACAPIQGGWVLLVPKEDAPEELQHLSSIYDHGYGEPGGTQGVNCMHRLYIQMYDPELAIEKKYDQEQAMRNAEIVSKQRRMEAAIRNAKKQLNAANALGNKEDIKHFRQLVRKRQSAIRTLISEYKEILHRDYSREAVFS
ncbi:phage minor capsid protein [Enterococcus faecium]|uniref:phage minor capsid protein n=1 Tax=Enterococcus faecium TaxID=1352 RepID=UPI000F4E9246|nr:phage minor capsid protein [Enterococcus faecium]ROY16674.1 phage capsid protein [Enterococcus faecium]HAR1751247.1 phage capsid protein [Enterococcus faecium]